MVRLIVLLSFGLLVLACGGTPPVNPAQPVGGPAKSTQLKVVLDPKEATAYIEVRTPEELRKLFLAMSNDSDFPEAIRTFFLMQSQSASSGSGFVVARLEQDGGTLIVTNRHVIDATDVPMVSFDQGETQSRGKIIYIDQDYDLAVIELSAWIPGLALETSYADRQDVYALGYPGLAGKGSYQATRGSISNRCLKESLLGGASNHCFIQHSAPIDPGSSGGPLLDEHNRVIGANVGLVSRRQSLNLAVPAEAIKNAIVQAEKVRASRGDTDWMMTGLKQACYRFMGGLDTNKADGDSLAQAVSYRLVAQKGMLAYQVTDNAQINAMFESDPFQAMRFSIVEFMYQLVKSNKGLLASERCEQVNPADDVLNPDKDVRIKVALGSGQRMELAWRFEHGRWRLANF